MTLQVTHVTFDCADAARLAGFWAEALGREIGPEASEQFAIIAGGRPAGVPDLLFLQVPEGRVAKNRVHLDLSASDREQEVDRLLALGASRVHDKEEYGVRWTTLRDPEGNEFCVSEEPAGS